MDDNFEEQLGAAMEERFNQDEPDEDDRGAAQQQRSVEEEPSRQRSGRDDQQASGPPFSYDEADVSSLYPEQATWRAYNATRSSLDARIIQNHGIDDLAKREVDNAALQLAADHPDLLEAYILKNRGLADQVDLDIEEGDN